MNKLKGEVMIKTEKSKLDAELKANEALLDQIAKRQAELANMAIDKWYNDELAKMKNNPNYQYANTKQENKIVIEDKLWRASNLQDDVYYLFKNGQPINNELIYIENGKTHKGSWEYLIPGKEIKITILNSTHSYSLENLTERSVNLKSALNDNIELIVV